MTSIVSWGLEGGGRETHFPIYTRLMHNRINLVSGHARLRSRSRNIEYLSRQPTNLPHGLALRRTQDRDLAAAAPKGKLAARDPIRGVVRPLDFARHNPQRG